MTLSNQQITKRFNALATYHNSNSKDLDAVQIKQHERFEKAIVSSGAIYQMGEAFDQLLTEVNSGLGQRAIDTQGLKKKNIKAERKESLGLSSDKLDKAPQRLQEAHRLFVYHKEIKEYLDTCENPPASCTNIFKNMVSEGVNPWPIRDKKEKTVEDLAQAINKLIEKTSYSLSDVVMSVENLTQRKAVHEMLQVDLDAKQKIVDARREANNKVEREKTMTSAQILTAKLKADGVVLPRTNPVT